MKTKLLRISVVLLMVGALQSSQLYGRVVSELNSLENPDSVIKADLEELYGKFEKYVKEKNKEAFLKLFVHEFGRLNIVSKKKGVPKMFLNTATTWANSFTRNELPYRVDISDTEYEWSNNVAISVAHFDNVSNNVKNGFGKDVFMYVKTSLGWKLLLTNNTYIALDDDFDYSKLQIEAPLKSALDSMLSTFNRRDADGFVNTFASSLMPCFSFSEVFSEAYSTTNHVVKAFSDSLLDKKYALTLELEGTEALVNDDYLGKSISGFTMKYDGQDYLKGKMFATYVATPNRGWKISALVFSITEKKFDLPTFPSSAHNQKGERLNFIYGPNPSSDKLEISYDNHLPGDITIKIIGSSGQTVNYLVDEFQPIGRYSYILDTQKMAAGISFIYFQNSTTSLVRKVLIVK